MVRETLLAPLPAPTLERATTSHCQACGAIVRAGQSLCNICDLTVDRLKDYCTDPSEPDFQALFDSIRQEIVSIHMLDCDEVSYPIFICPCPISPSVPVRCVQAHQDRGYRAPVRETAQGSGRSGG